MTSVSVCGSDEEYFIETTKELILQQTSGFLRMNPLRLWGKVTCIKLSLRGRYNGIFLFINVPIVSKVRQTSSNWMFWVIWFHFSHIDVVLWKFWVLNYLPQSSILQYNFTETWKSCINIFTSHKRISKCP